MTNTTAQLLEDQNAALRAALALQDAQATQSRLDCDRIDDLLNRIVRQNAEMLSVLSMAREAI